MSEPPRLCRQFLRGSCRYDPCKFSHDVSASGDRGESRGPAKQLPKPREAEREGGRSAHRRHKVTAQVKADEYGSGGDGSREQHFTGKGVSKLPMPRVNTESFTPSLEPPTMRVVIDLNPEKLAQHLTVRDVLVCPCIFKRPGDENIYSKIVKEIEGCPVPQRDLLKSWHGDSHWIADDKCGWKKHCPTFLEVIERIRLFFSMDIKATRFNWYKDTSEWKPYHHDAAAVKPDKARTQNFTVAVSFGATRVAAFEDAQTKTTVAFPLPDGTVYCFARDTNILWRHGILQEREVKDEGRISVIAWGWVTLNEMD